MGVAVSSWPLARAVALRGQLGVVSGTGLDTILARRLQLGDPGGHMRRAMDQFPLQEIAERVWDRYFVSGGKKPGAPFKSKPLPAIRPSKTLLDLSVLGSFVEVFLAKSEHRGLVGINLLEKIQLPTIPALFGAMMAGVDYVLMGAGIPRAIPAILDDLAASRPTQLRIDVSGALPGESFATHFDPRDYTQSPLRRPNFLAIVSSSALATTLARKSTGQVDGFVVEGCTAGGHNAPPRGALQLSEKGEPVYGPRDAPDLESIRELGLPFWMAGSYGTPQGLQAALELGAAGVQVGTPFAFCEESGILATIKARVLEAETEVFTDPQASPTGFPFKVAQIPGTLAEPSVFEQRERICDLGFLRECYRKEDGTVGYRCPAEPVEDFERKGGDPARTEGRKCLCNSLIATVGMPQVRRDGAEEPPIVTAGDCLASIRDFLPPGKRSYTAGDVIDRLLSASPAAAK
ncbi:MAG TPA: nitronate monooxygenase [Fimbriimonadaceae bacterium]|nr:nitronate monooxygenase [Fimbriimonadaceae bacterium]